MVGNSGWCKQPPLHTSTLKQYAAFLSEGYVLVGVNLLKQAAVDVAVIVIVAVVVIVFWLIYAA